MHTNQFLRVIDTLTESDGCWEWPMARRRTGYGHLTYGRRQIGAHRVAFQLLVRPLRDGEVVMHMCDNPACVNPAHLRAGTQAENIADRERKRRGKGAKPTCSRGHLLIGDNVRLVRRGPYVGRQCCECKRLTNRLYEERRPPRDRKRVA